MKIAIVGADKVCIGLINNLILSHDNYEILIIDKFEGPRDGNILDFEDILGFANSKFKIKAGNFSDLENIDLLIIGAKSRVMPGQLEHELYEENARVIVEIAYFVKQSGFKGLTILLTQPTSVLAKLYAEHTGLELEKIVGFGTMIENLRLHKLLREQIQNYEFDAVVLGDKNNYFTNFDEIKEKYRITDSTLLTSIFEIINKKDMEIFVKKGNPHFAASFVLFKFINSIYHKKEYSFIVNVFAKKYYDFEENFISLPAVVNIHGVKRIKTITLSQQEQNKLLEYGHRLNNLYENIKKIC
ncbi:lactate/malate family dehydrogenase [Mycoplasma sp. 1654_15]|uniref:lactate/malate family dehydrogenase n=1 Tax=Mycoplasma sp. 1654_15 TaxID=2725994 RepID=UPI0014497265|nr:lactate dehydrogenase [Mycoplasma sp. 1654_15]QJB70939.1 lactate dehydrogenase [Mycoplasma sp. 1654_15]